MKQQFLRSAIIIGVLCLGTSVFSQESSQPSNSEAKPVAQQHEQAPAPVQISSKDMKKLIVKKVRPEYSEIARNARIVGKCGVRVVISPQGDLSQVKLVYGHPILAPAALDAVRKWKFRPYLLQGHPVEVEGEVELNVP